MLLYNRLYFCFLELRPSSPFGMRAVLRSYSWVRLGATMSRRFQDALLTFIYIWIWAKNEVQDCGDGRLRRSQGSGCTYIHYWTNAELKIHCLSAASILSISPTTRSRKRSAIHYKFYLLSLMSFSIVRTLGGFADRIRFVRSSKEYSLEGSRGTPKEANS